MTHIPLSYPTEAAMLILLARSYKTADSRMFYREDEDGCRLPWAQERLQSMERKGPGTWHGRSPFPIHCILAGVGSLVFPALHCKTAVCGSSLLLPYKGCMSSFLESRRGSGSYWTTLGEAEELRILVPGAPGGRSGFCLDP